METNRLKALWERVSKDDKLSWVSHAVIGVLLAAIFSPSVAIGYYLIRELEQVFMDRFVYRRPLKPMDHIMDVLAPAGAVGLLWLL